MDKFIDFINQLYQANKPTAETLCEIIKYYQTNHFNIEWLDDLRIQFNTSNRSPIIEAIKLSANVLDKIDTKYYCDAIKYGIEFLVMPYNLKEKRVDEKIIEYLKKSFACDRSDEIPLDDDCYNINSYDYTFNCFNYDRKELKIKTKRYIDYDMFNDPYRNFYYLSYFKCAINFIVNHPLFKKYDNREYEELINNKEYETSKYYYNASIKLWKLLSDNKFTEIVNFYNNITDNQNVIAMPDIHHNPYKILQELLYYLGNDFSNMFYRLNHFIFFGSNIKHDIEFHLSRCNQKSIFIYLPKPFDNLFDSFEIQNLWDFWEDYYEVYDSPDEWTIQNEIDFYLDRLVGDSSINYDYLVGDYYLTSFCFTEWIIDGNIYYRHVFVKINYDENFNVISKVRYDDKEMEYEQNKYQFMDNELKIFNQTGINEYYDDNNKYHINMLCYVKK